MSCRIIKLEIQGFRSFGKNAQTLALPSQLAAVWGSNSLRGRRTRLGSSAPR